ncbi:hypothetical protein ACFWZ2_12995 [Streptomyces sp. NPDC059002]|uniref:hypothetical protein n=1 Tax=Streptomyces sp. NPDC059002 TaxID=3346690 RepID=UPI00369DD9CA
MSAPYRIRRRSVTRVGRTPGEDVKEHLDHMMRVIPGDVLALYLMGYAAIPRDEAAGRVVWFGICLVVLVVVRIFGTADPAAGLPPQPVGVIVPAVAFVVWVYATGGPFEDLHIAVGWVGALAVFLTSFAVPYLVQGEIEEEDGSEERDGGGE